MQNATIRTRLPTMMEKVNIWKSSLLEKMSLQQNFYSYCIDKRPMYPVFRGMGVNVSSAGLLFCDVEMYAGSYRRILLGKKGFGSRAMSDAIAYEVTWVQTPVITRQFGTSSPESPILFDAEDCIA